MRRSRVRALIGCAALAACGDDLARTPDAAVAVTTGGVLWAPPEVAVGRRFPVLFLAADATATGAASLVGAARPARLAFYRGRGAASAIVDRPGDVTLTAPGAPIGADDLTIRATERDLVETSGTLASARWTAAADVRVVADLVVADLMIDAGARVLLAAGADVRVTGTLIADGTPAAPIVWAADDPDAPWGGLTIAPGATADLAATWFIDGGGDPAQAFGHSRSQPVVRVADADLALIGGGVLDSPGKAFGAVDATLVLDDVVVARCDTGGELSRTALAMARAHVLEMPDADGVAGDEDNDGLYLQGRRLADGVPVVSTVTDSVFAIGEDDGIDHNGADVAIERVWIEGFRHEGVAASTGGTVLVRDAVVRGCEQGVEAGYGAPEVRLEHALITDNQVGLRFGDGYDDPATGRLTATASIVAGNVDDVRNFVVAEDGPRPGAIEVGCSYVDDPDAVGEDNLGAPPALDGVCLPDPAAAPVAPCGPSPAGPLTCPTGPP